jgi:outer membrane protein assembly factor BamB
MVSATPLLVRSFKFFLGFGLMASLQACSTLNGLRSQLGFGEKEHQGRKENQQFQSGPPLLSINWVSPTYDQLFLAHRKMNRMTPVITDDLVIQGNNLKDLVAVSRKWGREVWRREFKGGVEASALAFKGRIYVPANDGTLSALDLQTGRTLWSFSSSSENVSAPILDPQTGLLYFQNSQNLVFCLDAESGKQVWLYSRNDGNLMTIRGAATPALADGVVYVGFSDGTFAALKSSGGQVLWEQTLNRNKKFRDIDGQAVVDGEFVIVSGYDDKVYGLDRERGTILWTFPAGSYASGALGEPGFFYVGTTNGQFLKLKASTGELIWSYKEVKGVPTKPMFLNGVVYFGESQGRLKGLDRETGRLVSSFEPGRGIYSTPALDLNQNEIFFVSGEAYLYSLKLVRPSRKSFSFIE